MPDHKPRLPIAVDSFVAAAQAAEQGVGDTLGLEPFVTIAVPACS